jgi:beta-xylosidase
MSLRARLAAAVLAVLLVAGCAGGNASPGASSSGSGGGPGQSGSAPSSGQGSATAGASTAPSPAAGEFVNPVIARDMPDPFILLEGGTYYLYSTSDGVRKYPYATSSDLVTWEQQGDSMPRPPRWSNGNYWAPEVARIGDTYAMYFTARTPSIKRNDGQSAQCVGVAVADSPEGPFVDDTDEPLVCQAKLGGTIDASPFVDADGTRWLIYKNDGNCCGIKTRFFMRRLAEDGRSFVGEEVEVPGDGAQTDDGWEGRVVEAPNIHFADGTYYLFFSGNDYRSVDYAVGYATSDNVTGPYVDAEENPILETPDEGQPFGPGHQTLVTDADGDLWLVYHAWDDDFLIRYVWIDELILEDGKATVEGPDTGPQPVP